MDEKHISKVSAVALNDIFGFEPKFSHRIIDALGSAEAVFSLSESEKISVFGPYSKYLPQINDSSLEAAEKQLDALENDGYGVLTIYDEGYPAALRDCVDAPMVLYVRSSTPPEEIFNRRTAVSIVGTRDISMYGKEWCERIVKTLSQAPDKPMIVSGMAIGVDITAQMAALCFGLPTVGVLPVGINDIYPHRHRVAADKICATPGCAMVTDYPPGTEAMANHFLRRNRIIAGIGQSTILIESKAKGGGMMTCRLSASYGREVFALPGRIDDIRSEGCNLLIKEKVAEPVYSLEELPAALGLGIWNRRQTRGLEDELRDLYSGDMEPEELEKTVRIASLVKKCRGISFDEICESAGMDYADVSRLAGILENDGVINVDLIQRCGINAKNY